LELKSRPERLEQMRQSARHMACAASWDSVFEQVFEAYAASLRLAGAGGKFSTRTPLAANQAANLFDEQSPDRRKDTKWLYRTPGRDDHLALELEGGALERLCSRGALFRSQLQFGP